MIYGCPNFNPDHASQIDQIVRFGEHIGRPAFDADGVQMVIEYYSAFEAFNTRPYHNYESWGAGWRIRLIAKKERGFEQDIVVENECLVCGTNEAMRKLKEARAKAKEGGAA